MSVANFVSSLCLYYIKYSIFPCCQGLCLDRHALCYYIYVSERQPQRDVSGGVPKRNAEAYHHEDMALSRLTPELVLPEGGGVPEKVADQLVQEVDEFLAAGEVRSKSELDRLVQKLDSAIAINNHPKATTMRAELIEKFGNDVK